MSLKDNRRGVWAWCFYDWANSVFALTVMAAFFPVFFKGYWSGGVDSAVSTARLGFGNAIAGLSVAVLSPLLGALAGAGKAKKKYLAFFIFLGIIMSGSLYFIPRGEWLYAIAVFILARMGYSLANLFYDSFLADISDRGNADFISSLGFGIGYLGCGILFIFNLFMYKRPEIFGIKSNIDAIRLSFLIVAVWWFVFSLPILFFVKQKTVHISSGTGKIIYMGIKKLKSTAVAIWKTPSLFFFLIAYWFYIDGVHTVVMMATDYGLSIGISLETLMIALLFVQFIAFPSAIIFGYIARIIGAKNVILIAIGVYVIITLGGAWIIKTGIHFIIFACVTGMVQGAIQALSRSFYTRMIPEGKETEFFGFFNMMGRFAIILGPAIVASCNIIVHTAGFSSRNASRFGISALSLLFIVGGILLLQIKNSGVRNLPEQL